MTKKRSHRKIRKVWMEKRRCIHDNIPHFYIHVNNSHFYMKFNTCLKSMFVNIEYSSRSYIFRNAKSHMYCNRKYHHWTIRVSRSHLLCHFSKGGLNQEPGLRVISHAGCDPTHAQIALIL